MRFDDHETDSQADMFGGQEQRPSANVAPTCTHCNDSDPQLRYCRNNNSIGWQCRSCLRACGNWLPHAALGELDRASLPPWVLR